MADQKRYKYIIFAFSHYYPIGGMNDIKGSTNSLSAAISHFNVNKGKDGWDHCQIVERDSWRIVYESE